MVLFYITNYLNIEEKSAVGIWAPVETHGGAECSRQDSHGSTSRDPLTRHYLNERFEPHLQVPHARLSLLGKSGRSPKLYSKSQ